MDNDSLSSKIRAVLSPIKQSTVHLVRQSNFRAQKKARSVFLSVKEGSTKTRKHNRKNNPRLMQAQITP